MGGRAGERGDGWQRARVARSSDGRARRAERRQDASRAAMGGGGRRGSALRPARCSRLSPRIRAACHRARLLSPSPRCPLPLLPHAPPHPPLLSPLSPSPCRPPPRPPPLPIFVPPDVAPAPSPASSPRVTAPASAAYIRRGNRCEGRRRRQCRTRTGARLPPASLAFSAVLLAARALTCRRSARRLPASLTEEEEKRGEKIGDIGAAGRHLSSSPAAAVVPASRPVTSLPLLPPRLLERTRQERREKEKKEKCGTHTIVSLTCGPPYQF